MHSCQSAGNNGCHSLQEGHSDQGVRHQLQANAGGAEERGGSGNSLLVRQKKHMLVRQKKHAGKAEKTRVGR